MSFKRISITPGIVLGKPRIKGTRISIEFILEKISEGATVEYLIDGYPNLTEEDIYEAVRYANAVLRNRWKISYNKRKSKANN